MVGCDAGSTGEPDAIRAAVGLGPPTHSNLAAHVGGTILAEIIGAT